MSFVLQLDLILHINYHYSSLLITLVHLVYVDLITLIEYQHTHPCYTRITVQDAGRSYAKTNMQFAYSDIYV